MDKKLVVAGAAFGMVGVILGAFAAHGLKPLLTAEAMQTFETGVRYQIYHSFLLLLLGAVQILPPRFNNICFWLLVWGIIIFSGSIYFLATNSLTDFNFGVIGFITPIGGSLLITVWVLLVWNFLKLKKK